MADDDDDFDIQPGDLEVTEVLNDNGEEDGMAAISGDVALLQRVQDQAAVIQETAKLLQPDEADEAPAKPDEDEERRASMNRQHFKQFFPLDEDADEAAQPKTVVDIVKRALRKGGAEHSIGETSALGHEACLKRLTSLLGGIRQFCCLVRLKS